MVAGVMAVVGHDWSVFIGFHGGIGLAKLGGGLLASSLPKMVLPAFISAFIVLGLWLGMIRWLHTHRARSTIFVMLLVGPLLWLLKFPLPVMLFGILGGGVVIVKTIPDWHRVYE
jgi:glycerol-3-phosphate acyltransferase PlsY